MKLTHILRIVNNPALDTLKKSIKLTIADAPQFINNMKEEKKKIMYEKFVRINNWYTKLIGLDEVKMYQDRVTSIQEKLLQTQEKRREAGRQLADIRQKSLELQDQIHKVRRQEDFEKFLDLMKQETEVLRMEQAISRTFQDYDQTERELFTAFSNAIRDSHEKQRAQIEYTKYFGLILSITGSFLAFVYTTVKKRDLKQFIEEKLGPLNSDPAILNLVKANENTLREVIMHREILNEVVRVLNTESKLQRNYIIPSPNVPTTPAIDTDELKINMLKVAGAVCVSYVILIIIGNIIFR